jgi:hypothetical protein
MNGFTPAAGALALKGMERWADHDVWPPFGRIRELH